MAYVALVYKALSIVFNLRINKIICKMIHIQCFLSWLIMREIGYLTDSKTVKAKGPTVRRSIFIKDQPSESLFLVRTSFVGRFIDFEGHST